MTNRKTPHNIPKKEIIIPAIWGIILLVISVYINYLAGTYASARAGHPVGDIILDLIPAINVNFIFVYGFAIFFMFSLALALYKPRHAPFILKSLSLFILIRALFVVMTHLGPLPGIQAPPKSADEFTFTGDLFFSAHTGLPFLMALIFWKEKYLHAVFLCISIIFAAAVLLGHLHYSIDVFSAFFITYGIYHIAIRIFAKDYRMFKSYYLPRTTHK